MQCRWLLLLLIVATIAVATCESNGNTTDVYVVAYAFSYRGHVSSTVERLGSEHHALGASTRFCLAAFSTNTTDSLHFKHNDHPVEIEDIPRQYIYNAESNHYVTIYPERLHFQYKCAELLPSCLNCGPYLKNYTTFYEVTCMLETDSGSYSVEARRDLALISNVSYHYYGWPSQAPSITVDVYPPGRKESFRTVDANLFAEYAFLRWIPLPYVQVVHYMEPFGTQPMLLTRLLEGNDSYLCDSHPSGPGDTGTWNLDWIMARNTRSYNLPPELAINGSGSLLFNVVQARCLNSTDLISEFTRLQFIGQSALAVFDVEFLNLATCENTYSQFNYMQIWNDGNVIVMFMLYSFFLMVLLVTMLCCSCDWISGPQHLGRRIRQLIRPSHRETSYTSIESDQHHHRLDEEGEEEEEEEEEECDEDTSGPRGSRHPVLLMRRLRQWLETFPFIQRLILTIAITDVDLITSAGRDAWVYIIFLRGLIFLFTIASLFSFPISGLYMLAGPHVYEISATTWGNSSYQWEYVLIFLVFQAIWLVLWTIFIFFLQRFTRMRSTGLAHGRALEDARNYHFIFSYSPLALKAWWRRWKSFRGRSGGVEAVPLLVPDPVSGPETDVSCATSPDEDSVTDPLEEPHRGTLLMKELLDLLGEVPADEMDFVQLDPTDHPVSTLDNIESSSFQQPTEKEEVEVEVEKEKENEGETAHSLRALPSGSGHHVHPAAYTVFVRDLPRDQTILAADIYGICQMALPDSVLAVHVAADLRQLLKAIASQQQKLRSALLWGVLAKVASKAERWGWGPRRKLSLWLMQKSRQRSQLREDEAQSMRIKFSQQFYQHQCAGCAFVTFKTPFHAMWFVKHQPFRQIRVNAVEEAESLLEGGSGGSPSVRANSETLQVKNWRASMAKAPTDVNWTSLTANPWERRRYTVVSTTITLSLVFFFTSCVFLVNVFTSFLNFGSFSLWDLAPYAPALLQPSELWQYKFVRFMSSTSLVLIPSLMVALLNLFIDRTIRLMSLKEGWQFKSEREAFRLLKSFLFQFINTILIPVCGFLLFASLVASTQELSLPWSSLFFQNLSVFYLKFVASAASVSLASEELFLQYELFVNRFLTWLRPKLKFRVHTNIYFDMTSHFVSILVVTAVGTVFGPAVPLVTPVCLFFFLLRYIYDKYNLVNIYPRQSADAGATPRMVTTLLVSILLSQAISFAVYSVIFAFSRGASPAWFFCVTAMISLYCLSFGWITVTFIINRQQTLLEIERELSRAERHTPQQDQDGKVLMDHLHTPVEATVLHQLMSSYDNPLLRRVDLGSEKVDLHLSQT